MACTDDRERRVCNVRVSPEALLYLLTQDGRTAFEFDVLPADATVAGLYVRADDNSLVLQLHSDAWEAVPEGDDVPELHLAARACHLPDAANSGPWIAPGPTLRRLELEVVGRLTVKVPRVSISLDARSHGKITVDGLPVKALGGTICFVPGSAARVVLELVAQ